MNKIHSCTSNKKDIISPQSFKRTKLQKKYARQLLKKSKGPLVRVTNEDLKKLPTPDWCTRAYKNNRYVVMVDDNQNLFGHEAVRLFIQRHDQKIIPNHWKELQKIKNELFGNEAFGIELFPPESKLVDLFNVYWLYILPDSLLKKDNS